jgi:hypothetical protein
MKYGKKDINDQVSKEKDYEVSRKFIEEFKKRNSGHIRCFDLVGFNKFTEEGQIKYEELNSKEEICLKFVKDAAVILEKLLFEN